MGDFERGIYRRRFGDDIEFRKRMYAVLCSRFFQRYVPPTSTVLDIAAGYCEFINTIQAAKKLALDINPDVKAFAASDVKVFVQPSNRMRGISNNSVDIAFTSNFFEHLSRDAIVETIKETHRVLRKGGEILVLQPNIRYCQKDYWMFFDHVTAVDDRALTEAFEVHGFDVVECLPRFLPFTTKGRLPKSVLLLKLYLTFPFLWRIFGQQAFIRARKV